jgi:hypothetical protein
MTIFTVPAKNKEHAKKIRTALKLIETEFSENSEEYIFTENLKKDIEKARKDKLEGNTITIDPSNIWKSIGLK